MRLLRSIVHAEGITAIVATHDPVLTGLPTASSASKTANWWSRTRNVGLPAACVGQVILQA